MKKALQIFFILTIITFTAFINLPVLATETDTNQNSSIINTESTTEVTSVSSINEGELTKSDMINIILIAVCIVLILLAGAIYSRLRR